VAPRVTSLIASVARQAATDAGQSWITTVSIAAFKPRSYSLCDHGLRLSTEGYHKGYSGSLLSKDGSASCQLNLVEQCT